MMNLYYIKKKRKKMTMNFLSKIKATPNFT